MRVFRVLLLAFLAAGSAAIAAGSLVYFDASELPPFVIEKLPLPRTGLFLFALKVHVASASFALPACIALFSAFIQTRVPRVHRWLGRIAGVVILAALVPSGFYLSLFAKGGLLSTLGFMLSGAVVAGAMVRAVQTARVRDFAAHRRFTLHVLSQLGVAVVSRAMLVGADALALNQDRAYVASLWIPVLGALLFAEYLSPSARRNHAQLDRTLARRHALGTSGLVVQPGRLVEGPLRSHAGRASG